MPLLKGEMHCVPSDIREVANVGSSTFLHHQVLCILYHNNYSSGYEEEKYFKHKEDTYKK